MEEKIKKYRKSEGSHPLTPITSSWMHKIMDSHEQIGKLMETHGSPINLHHLPSFTKNIEDFQNIFKKLEVNGQIYFARKANKSKSLVKAALSYGVGVDTASYRELQEALALGGNAENLVLTAAIKTRPLMELAVKNNISIIIDNYDELELVQHVAQEMDRIAHIGIRLSGFNINGQKLYSRFGFDIDMERDKLKGWLGDRLKSKNLLLCGFHFHLDGYSIEQRAEAILQTLDVIEEFDIAATKISFIDIGGGILMNYLESKEEWEQFQERLQQAVLEKDAPVTFKNNGLGFKKNLQENGITGKLNTYPYFNQINGPEFLERILTYKRPGDKPVLEYVRNENIQLRIEPGRSLLNQVGLTIAKVVHRKKDAENNWLVGLDMNMSQLKSSSADFLLDPYIIYSDPIEIENNIELYFTGAYCLEQDVILKRKLSFPNLPQIGDFVVFVNTGGYMMHFYETEAHLFELSKNLYIPDDNETILPDDTLSKKHRVEDVFEN